MTYQETPYQKTNIVDANGNVINSFGGSGGGGDASATNQETQIALETAIRDRLPTALVGGRLPVDVASLSVTVNNANLEISNDIGNPIPISSNVLTSIDNKTPDLGANTAANSTPVTLSTDGIFATLMGLASDAASITGSIHAKLRAIATSLIPGQALMAASVPVAIASNQSAVPVTVQDGLTISGNLSTTGNLFSQDTTGYQSVAIQVTSVGISSTTTYEQSNDNSTWYQTIGYDLSSTGGVVTSPSSTTIGLKIFPIYGKYFRARVSAFSSGVVSVTATFRIAPYQGLMNVQQSNGANLVASVAATVPARLVSNATGGLTYSRVKSAASTNAASIKNSSGQLYGWTFYNNTASAKFVKIYNKASAPTVGTDTPAFTIPLAPNSGRDFQTPVGIAFGTGISYAITLMIADTDTTATAVDDVTGTILYT